MGRSNVCRCHDRKNNDVFVVLENDLKMRATDIIFFGKTNRVIVYWLPNALNNNDEKPLKWKWENIYFEIRMKIHDIVQKKNCNGVSVNVESTPLTNFLTS